MKQSKPKYKIFKAGTRREVIKNTLKEGYMPASLEETYKYLAENKIEYEYWTTSLLEYKGELKNATKEQLENIDEIYKNGGRLWCVYRSNLNSVANGDNDLDLDNGRLFGVRRDIWNKLQAKKKVKK